MSGAGGPTSGERAPTSGEQGTEREGGSVEVRDQVAAEQRAGRAAQQRDEPEKISSIDAEYLAGKRFPYQEDRGLVEDVDLVAATPGEDINWLEDITLLQEDGQPAVFDRYSNAFLKIYFEIPEGREDELARKVLIKHLQSGNSYGIVLKEQHTKFPQPELGPWVEGSKTTGTDWSPSVLEGWEPPAH